MAAVSGAATTPIQARLANVRYAEKDYWDSRYKSQPCEFDWFYGYTALRKLVRAYVKRTKPVLHVGCGNSNFQEGMAKDGYQVVNTDISEVVIEQMRAKHKHIPGLRYVVSDCRNMPEFLDCQFGSVIDKGTVDALLCSKDAADNIRSMFREISRVLVPGGVFMLITLGAPPQRLSLVNRREFDWTVQVCLVRRVPDDEFAPSAPGRAIPLNDTLKPLSYLGPLEVQPDGTLAGLPEPFDPASYFYAYVCRRSPLVLPADNKRAKEAKVRLPEGWRATVRAVAEVVGGELKLPQGILGRGRRVKTTSRANFEREQRERELERERERRALVLVTHGSSESQLDTNQMGQEQSQSNHLDQQQPEQQQAQEGGDWGSAALEAPNRQDGEAGRGDGEGAEEREARQRALLDPLVGTADGCGGGDAVAATMAPATADGCASGYSSAFSSGTNTVTAVTPAASPLAATPASCRADAAMAVAEGAAAAVTAQAGPRSRDQPRPGRDTLESSMATKAISYRRLSATVQDAFTFLDAVDGTNCSSTCSNVLDPAAVGAAGCADGGGQDDRQDRP